MRFGLLGPLAAWTAAGEPVRIPEAKVRALLGALLVRRGTLVPALRLVDDLWAGDLPADPAGALQLKVSRLRRALDGAEPGARGLVVSEASGYRIDVSTDADEFREAVDGARLAADPVARAAGLAAALALWRGPALADLADARFAHAAAARLEEERLTAVEELAGARLELGEHAAVVAELGGLVAAHPLRQRLRGALMLALHHSDRDAEALDTFAELRRRLADEQGIDPGGELTDLQAAILRNDPALAPPVPRVRGNLPAAPDELIGRAAAVVAVREAVAANRLVTLTGPGGVGKTRLALEAARQLGRLGPMTADGVWLVELGAVGRDGVADAVAAALGVRQHVTPGAPHEEAGIAAQLAGAVTAMRALLVLDNCEHVVDGVAALGERLLAAGPHLRILATSQEPLAVAGEAVWPVPPLDLPAAGVAEPSGAVRLFVARARAADPDFGLTADNAAAVEAVCRRLDGIPLALEMAATRVPVLGPHALAERLDDRFRLLASGHRGAPGRQRTLRAVIEWSWELAAPAEQAVLRTLAVHPEGCTLDAAEAVCAEAVCAEAVCGAAVREEAGVADLLVRLARRSLVVVVPGTPPRYRMLESIRAYALEQLTGEELAGARRRHARYFTDLAAVAAEELRGPRQSHWLRVLDVESANLRVALADPAVARELAGSLTWYWYLRGRLSEGRRALDAVEGEVAAAWRAGFAFLERDGDDRLDFEVADAIADPGERARAQLFLGLAHRGFGDVATTEKLIGDALIAFERLGDRWGIAAALSVRATLARMLGGIVAARRDAAASVAMFRELGDGWGRLKAGNTLANAAEIEGDYATAERLHREGLRIAEELDLPVDVSFQLSGLGRIALMNGDIAAADGFHRRAADVARGQFDRVVEEYAEVGLALAARRDGRLDEAEAVLRRWVDWLRKVKGEPGLALVLAELGFIAELRGDAEAAFALHREGHAAATRIGDPRAVALALEGLAGAHALVGDTAEAGTLLAEAAALRESVAAPLPAGERADVDRIRARITPT